MTLKLTVSHEYSGMPDYWGGNARRWDDDAGCLFAHYGSGTTLRDCVDQWVDEFLAGGDCDNMPEDVGDNDVRDAILDSLTEQGHADYKSGALAECAAEYAYDNDLNGCRGCSAKIDESHEEGCSEIPEDWDENEECGVIDDDIDEDDDDMSESPVWIILVECEEDEESWTLAQYDDNPDLGDLAGKWCWVSDEEELGPYDSDAIAFENDPRIV